LLWFLFKYPVVVNLAVLASGSGTVLESILKYCQNVEAVVIDRPCRAADVAQEAGVKVVRHIREDFGSDFDRKGYTDGLVETLRDLGVDIVAMAGFGTILSGSLYVDYEAKVLNTHPSLLPSFPGWHAVRAALEYGVKVTGCTVHVATEVVDDGPILAQFAVPVLQGDDEAKLHERIKSVERSVYPRVIESYTSFLKRFRNAEVKAEDFWFDADLLEKEERI